MKSPAGQEVHVQKSEPGHEAGTSTHLGSRVRSHPKVPEVPLFDRAK